MELDYREERLVKCPILVAPERNVRLSERRNLECINCPVIDVGCFELINASGAAKMKLFLKEVRLTIAELRNIEAFIINEC